MRFQGTVAVVTGAGDGIDVAVARAHINGIAWQPDLP